MWVKAHERVSQVEYVTPWQDRVLGLLRTHVGQDVQHCKLGLET